jgi:hypothetical protein
MDKVSVEDDTIESANLSEFFSAPYRTAPYHTAPYRTVPYRTVPYRTAPQQTVYRSKKKRKINGKRHFLSKRSAFLTLIFPIARSVP